MIFLGLFDERGQIQRVAIAENSTELSAFLDAGFVEITEDEYNAFVAEVDQANISDLFLLSAAAALLSSIAGRSAPEQPAAPDRVLAERVEAATRERTQQATRDYYAGRVTIDQWQRRMIDAVNQANIAARAAAVGGASNLTADDLAAIERANETQARYIRRFRRDLEAGRISEAQAVARAGQYATASGPVFETGMTRAMGLPLLPAYPKLRTLCMGNCKCQWRIEALNGPGNWNCYWELAPAEHCETCLARQRAFNPLRIRNGIIQPYSPVGIYA